MQVVFGGKRNGGNHKVDAAAGLPDAFKHRFYLPWLCNVQWQNQGGVDLSSQGLHMGSSLVIEIGQRDVGTEGTQFCRTSESDAVGIGHPHYQAALALEHVANAGVFMAGSCEAFSPLPRGRTSASSPPRQAASPPISGRPRSA